MMKNLLQHSVKVECRPMSCSFTPLASVEDCVTVFVRHCAALIAPLTIHVGLYVAGR